MTKDYAAPDWRGLCEELVEAVDTYDATGEDLTAALDRARAALAEEPAPPVEGEVAELVARLRRASDGASAMGWEQDSWIIARAAVLLEQRHPTPVSVSERLPGPGDCDAEGRCWWGKPYGYRGRNIEEPYWVFGDSDCYRFMSCTLWLPAAALPLPQGEVQP